MDEFSIRPLQWDSYLLTGASQHTPSVLSSSRTTNLPSYEKAQASSNDKIKPNFGMAELAELLRCGEVRVESVTMPSVCDSDSDSSSEDGQYLSPTKNIPWDELDEQPLRYTRKEGRTWKGIFKKFLTRTEPAIHRAGP
jgi:hypothetical protein